MTMYALGCLDLHGQLTAHSSLCSVCQALSWCWSHVGSHQHGCAPGALIALGVPGKGCGEESFSSRESGKSQARGQGDVACPGHGLSTALDWR